MGLPHTIRTVAKVPLNALLELQFLRRQIIFELNQRYYSELEIAVPLGFELSCPVSFPDAWASFTEIFVDSEYSSAFETIPLPDRWLDLGCHAGFFSLFIAWTRAKKALPPSFKALLVDGDNRVQQQVERLISINKLEGRMLFQHGLISDREGPQEFVERSHMASSRCRTGLPSGTTLLVKTVNAAKLLSLLAPPYDLVKVDLEGGEYDFLTAYKPVLEATSFLLLEWHSWHAGGGGAAGVLEMARDSGFELVAEVVAAHDVMIGAELQQCGVFLFGRAKRP